MNKFRRAHFVGRHREAAKSIAGEYLNHPLSTLAIQLVGSIFMSTFIEFGLSIVEPDHEFNLRSFVWTVPLGLAGLWTWDAFRFTRHKVLERYNERFM